MFFFIHLLPIFLGNNLVLLEYKGEQKKIFIKMNEYLLAEIRKLKEVVERNIQMVKLDQEEYRHLCLMKGNGEAMQRIYQRINMVLNENQVLIERQREMIKSVQSNIDEVHDSLVSSRPLTRDHCLLATLDGRMPLELNHPYLGDKTFTDTLFEIWEKEEAYEKCGVLAALL